MTGQVLITVIIVSLATLVSIVDGQFSAGHSHHGRGDVRCMYCTPGTCDNVTNTCTSCLDGFYGDMCKQTCSNTCMSCDKVSGNCLKCMNGFFGEGCNKECPRCDTCDKVTGACTSCWSNNWGDNCQNTCEETCQRCNVATGECQYCATGFYGEGCNLKCDYCRQGMCDRDFGKCSYGCNDGQYGEKCELSCPQKCRVCNQNDGRCMMCEPPLWGEYCDSRCPVNCDFCNITTGECLECNPGFYSEKCALNCHNCMDGYCEKDTGYCQGACLEGWFGAKCDKKCMKHCRRCTEENKCMLCEKGLAGENCDVQCPTRCPTCANDILTGNIMCMECGGDFKIPEKNCSCTNTKCTKITEIRGKGFACERCAEGWYLREGTCCPCHHCAGGNQFCEKNGNCKNGCEPKYFPATEGCDQYCDIPHCTWCESFYGHGKICKGCDEGYFLERHGCTPCSSFCKGGSLRCNQMTGVCLDGCKSGGYGERCDSSCPDKHCPHLICNIKNCDVCEKSTSSAAKCRKCRDGYYESNGKCLACSLNCKGTEGLCDSITGKCLEGCKTGWTGDKCDVENVIRIEPSVKICRGSCLSCDSNTGECAACVAGSWGSRCNKICPENCRTCDHKTGKCVVFCSKYCKRVGNELLPCDSITGECLYGCVEGWMGETCRYKCPENGKCTIMRKPVFETVYFRK